ncbi:Fe-S oxidoreductase [Psychrobacillus sp. FSL K6-2684]|uniref:Fe-S oxidoreductase n=1 Tax=Psychrobacillus sp. FSL K6-2684 TaxID=2921547 RepID=UPI0030F73B7F
MPAITFEQEFILNEHRIHTSKPLRTLFTLERLSKEFFQDDFSKLMQGITEAKNQVAAVSHFAKRYGMFFANQFYMLAAYDMVWDGKHTELHFDVTKEYGAYTIAMFINPNDFRYVKEEEREEVIRKILSKQGYEIVQQLRNTTSISPLIIWESFFVHLVNQYEKLLEDPSTAGQAMDDIEILENPEVWKLFSTKSLFYEYTQGRNPAVLVNQPIRRSCCMSMDLPGQGACGYCPKTNK